VPGRRDGGRAARGWSPRADRPRRGSTTTRRRWRSSRDRFLLRLCSRRTTFSVREIEDGELLTARAHTSGCWCTGRGPTALTVPLSTVPRLPPMLAQHKLYSGAAYFELTLRRCAPWRLFAAALGVTVPPVWPSLGRWPTPPCMSPSSAPGKRFHVQASLARPDVSLVRRRPRRDRQDHSCGAHVVPPRGVSLRAVMTPTCDVSPCWGPTMGARWRATLHGVSGSKQCGTAPWPRLRRWSPTGPVAVGPRKRRPPVAPNVADHHAAIEPPVAA